MKKIAAAAVLLAATSMAPTAFAQDISFSAGVDSVSEYVFRGTSLGAESLQTYSEVSIGDFTAGAWYSAGLVRLQMFKPTSWTFISVTLYRLTDLYL